MRIRAFHANDGDCLLITTTTEQDDGSVSERNILVDGGRSKSFKKNARDTIYGLDKLDIVYLSHIDEDHIAGILTLVEDLVEWRVHSFRLDEGLPTTEPSFPRPPEIVEIWHNSLFELVGRELEPEVQPAMATSSSVLTGSTDAALASQGFQMANLATGERSAMELSRRISDRQLDIARNRPRNKIMQRTTPRSHRRLDPITFRILGPSEDDIIKLRTRWQKWIDGNAKALRKLQREMLEDEEELGTLSAGTVARPIGASLGEGASGVSAPNLASLMLHVKEKDGGTILLTGDGVSQEILDGLDFYNMRDDGRFHCNVLKLQHHGALGNVTEAFVDSVTADDYLFCGGGADENPELEVVEEMAMARLTGRNDLPPVGPGTDFKFWFTSSQKTVGLVHNRQAHMGEVEELVIRIKELHDDANRFSFEFLDNGFLEIEVPTN